MNVGAFNAQLRRMGQDMLWARASRCPCVDAASCSPSATCKVCRARGYLWAAPVPCRAGLSGMSVQREWAQFGQFESGDVVVSVGSDQPHYGAAEMDRIVFSQSSESFDYVQVRGAVQEFRLMVPATVTIAAGSVIVATAAPPSTAFPVLQFDRCFWLNDAKDTVIDGELPQQAADGTIAWPDGGAPPNGTQYTLQGRKCPEYFMFGQFGRDRAHFGGQALPRRLALRKWSLFPA